MNRIDLINVEEKIRNKIKKEYIGITFVAEQKREEVIYTFLCRYSEREEPLVVEVALDYSMLPFFYRKEYVELVLENMEKELQHILLKRFKK